MMRRNSATETGRRAGNARRLAWLALAFVSCLAAIAVSGCSGPSDKLPVYTGGSELPASDPAYATAVQVRYLGAGGVVIKRGPDVIVTAPFFSNPSIPRVAFAEIQSRPDQIDRFLDRPGNGLAGTKAILVGHAHYDHLMDVPYIKSKYLPQVRIYGSETMKNTLAGDKSIPGSDVQSVETDLGSEQHVGKWWRPEGGRIRFMALKSEHAPIFWHLKFFEGSYEAPLSEIPKRAYGWREGQTLAYLIDFLGADDKVEFRVHYQDAASNSPFGFPPQFDPGDDPRPVDLAIVCMPGFDQVKDYPKAILDRLKPRYVVIIHWEDFFALLPDDAKDLRTVPTEDAEGFLSILHASLENGATFKLPAPGAWMTFAP
ncbi:MAG: hypothetical protein IT521_12390 [Burkholderiales bacterium]|nr:hypothetical protein [Burkholderiales bacterium]